MLQVLLVTLIGTLGIVATFALGVTSLSKGSKTFACIWFTVCGALVVGGLYLYVT
ncbi:hypothetical protein GCM10011609_28260 [Lentzea pudingi]|uniref:Uncharacterized protein n=1 Tax=Lentzea pudingi TaxID=1789439 RepID=A0ABQ2HTP2_9PSEU|nr:hypothetical protein [Lentzea pudingi]GGM89729.1 hypothetical protein GCM10011609_28260 [Lentzea pudingi]